MTIENEADYAAWAGLLQLVEAAQCALHRKEGSHIVVVENMWDSSDTGEWKPLLRIYPDSQQGYVAARSAILQRYPYLSDETIVCARCSKPKPLDQYDLRFRGKSGKKVCADCRTAAKLKADASRLERMESERLERAALDQAKRVYKERYPYSLWKIDICRTIEEVEELGQQLERQESDLEEWLAYCRSLGFFQDDISFLANAHHILSYRERHPGHWSQLKSAFLALDPPYTGYLERHSKRLSAQQRTDLYEQQGGRCAYCECDLLPLNYRELPQRMAHYRDIPNFSGVIPPDGMVMLDREGMPEVDHRVPVTRGGTDDWDNLCFACRRCNNRKDVRTDKEFRQMPDDTISKLGMSPQLVMQCLLYEQKGYERFDDANADSAASLFRRTQFDAIRHQSDHRGDSTPPERENG